MLRVAKQPFLVTSSLPTTQLQWKFFQGTKYAMFSDEANHLNQYYNLIKYQQLHRTVLFDLTFYLFRPKSKRVASPTTSNLSMKTDWSMDPPTNFQAGDTFPLHSR